jgi:hypothetical protein
MKPIVFFDLDGVLANFVEGACKAHNSTLHFEPHLVTWGFPAQIGFTGVDDPRFWAPLGFDFWANLPAYEDGFALLKFAEETVGVERIGILTSPCDTPGCVDGKRAWVNRLLPSYRRRLFVGSAKELFAGPGKVLVDDHDPNCERFEVFGGRAVTPPRPWNRRKDECVSGGFNVARLVDELLAPTAVTETDYCPLG